MVTVAEVLRTKNARERQHIPEVLRRGTTIKVFNIFDQDHNISLGSLGTFYIPACEPGQPHSKALEIRHLYFDEYPTDMTERGNKTAYNTFEGSEVAKEVVGTASHKDETDNLTKWGVFVAAGELPTAAELATAKAALTANMVALVSEADKNALNGAIGAQKILARHRKALAYLNQKRSWAEEAGQLELCPACGESINPGVAICKHCDAVFDHERAKKFMLGPYKTLAHVPVAPVVEAVAEPTAKPKK